MARIILYCETPFFPSSFLWSLEGIPPCLGPGDYRVPEQSWVVAMVWQVVVPASQVFAEKLEWPKPNHGAEEGRETGSSVPCRIFSGSFALPFVPKCASLEYMLAAYVSCLIIVPTHTFRTRPRFGIVGQAVWDWNQPLGWFLHFNFLEPFCFLISPLLTWSSAWSLGKTPGWE